MNEQILRAAYARACAELGKVFGEMVMAQEEAATLRAEVVALRAQLAASQDQIQKEVD